uniref:Uncharacterized protein n=1 Tax=Anopheles quadriannulatus TaxID=34691 RepID=A0A182XEK3_ANOQN
NVPASDSGTDLLPCAVSSYAIIFCLQLKQTSFRSPPAPYTAPAGKGARMQFRQRGWGRKVRTLTHKPSLSSSSSSTLSSVSSIAGGWGKIFRSVTSNFPLFSLKN